MALTQRLELRQSQSLVMTPQLQQAIKLLQLSNIELSEFVEQELETNPLLESEERRDSEAPDGETSYGEDAAAADAEGPAPTADSASLTDSDNLPAEAEAPLDTDPQELYDYSPSDGALMNGQAASTGGAAGDGSYSIDQGLGEAPTLRQHLLDQLTIEITDPADRLVGLHLIDMLDEAGYVVGSLEDLAAHLGCPLQRVEDTLAKA